MNLIKWFKENFSTEYIATETKEQKQAKCKQAEMDVRSKIYREEKYKELYRQMTLKYNIATANSNINQMGQGTTINTPEANGTPKPFAVHPSSYGTVGPVGMPGTLGYPPPTPTIDPLFGFNEELGGLIGVKAIVAVKDFDSIPDEIIMNFVHGDILLAMDTMKMYQLAQSTWVEIVLRPNLTTEIQTKPEVIKEDRKEIFDAFEKNLTVPEPSKQVETFKDDRKGLLQKATDWLQSPLEPDAVSYQ